VSESATLLTHLDARGVATLTLNRPEIHNAFDDALIADLTLELTRLDGEAAARVVVLAANGKSFSAGADLNWMRRMANYTPEQNLRDAMGLAALMRTLNDLRKPTIARVQGSAFGGGVGLVACCDMAIAADETRFCLSEVRLGLVPAAISPYVIAAMGQRASRRYFLTAERFSAHEAHRLGLVHDVCPAGELDARVDALADALLLGGPQALAAAKDLVFAVANRPIDRDLSDETARRIATLRASPEGRDGVAAFLEKRKPRWIP
jgi:methylglutaconyl-CoA hydratase